MSSTSPYRATPVGGAVDAGQHVQAGRLAGPVRADQRVHRARPPRSTTPPTARRRRRSARSGPPPRAPAVRGARPTPGVGAGARSPPTPRYRSRTSSLAGQLATPARAARPGRPPARRPCRPAASAIAAFCSTSTTAVPLRWISRDHLGDALHHQRAPAPATARPAAAPAGPAISARAIASICCSPPESRPARWPARCAQHRETSRRPVPAPASRARVRSGQATGAEVLLHGQMLEDLAALRAPGPPRPGRSAAGSQAIEPGALELDRPFDDAPADERQRSGDRPQQRGLAGAVGSEDGDQAVARHLDVTPCRATTAPAYDTCRFRTRSMGAPESALRWAGADRVAEAVTCASPPRRRGMPYHATQPPHAVKAMRNICGVAR